MGPSWRPVFASRGARLHAAPMVIKLNPRPAAGNAAAVHDGARATGHSDGRDDVRKSAKARLHLFPVYPTTFPDNLGADG